MPTRWTGVPVPPAASALRAAGYASPLAELLAQRGIASADDAARRLHPALDQLSPITAISGFSESVERLHGAVARRERVVVLGDYDVDGVTATALLAASLKALGGTVETVLPRRDAEGYGLQPLHVERAVAAGAALLVAVDSGTIAYEAWAEAARLGVELLIVDHHLPASGGPAPRGDGRWLVNPKLDAEPAEAIDLTAAGLTARLAAALFERAGREVPWNGLLRLAALGTIADVAPLRGDNRVLTALGLAALAGTPSPGLQELMRRASTRPPFSAADVAFRLAPRLNAAGRLGTADVALELLTTRDATRAESLASQLETWNSERQSQERRILDDARAQLASLRQMPGLILLSSPGWHRGVVGVAAARLARELHRPTILLAEAGAEATGSGRSVAGLALHELIAPWSGELTRFGGHAQAIGLTVATDRIDRLRAAWEDAAAGWVERLATREVRYDLEIAVGAVDAQLVAALDALSPFGAGNPEPIFRFGPCVLAGSPATFGRGHLRFPVAEAAAGSPRREVVAWNGAETYSTGLPAVFELLAAVELDRYAGVRLRLTDLRGIAPPSD